MNLALRYAIILAILSILISLIGHFSGLQATMGWLFTALSTVVFVGVLHVAMLDARKQEPDFPFGKAFGLGIRISLISGVITGVFSAIGAASFLKEQMATQMQAEREKMLAKGMAEDQVDQGMKFAEMFTSPVSIFFISLLSALILGAIISAILGAINKREEKISA